MMGLGIINLAESATLAGGNWLAGLPVTNVATRDYAEVSRSTNDSAASTVISLDHGSAKTARVVCIGWHNLSAAATITWTRGTTAGGSDVYAGGAVNAWQIAPGAFDGRQYAAWVVAEATSAQHDTISITDESNPDGYVEIGYLWVGDLWTTTYGPSNGLTHGVQDFSGAERGDGGAFWSTRRRRIRNATMVLEAATPSEAAVLHDIQVYSATTEPVLYCADRGIAEDRQRYGFVGLLGELSGVEWPYHRHGRLPLRVVEL